MLNWSLKWHDHDLLQEIYFLNELPKSIEDIEKYAEKTNVNLLELSLQILGNEGNLAIRM